MDKKMTILFACIIFLGLAVSAFVIGRSIERFRNEDRYISVRGFSEREVKADLTVWSLKLNVASDDLSEGSRLIDSAKMKAIQFLTHNGINSDEIIQKGLQVSDRKAKEYGSTGTTKELRYIITKIIQVRSNNVDNVQKVSRMTDELLRAGVVISSTDDWQGTGIRFVFTKLNEIKPAMLAEATGNAKNAALEFAKESNTSLGKMRKASQGLFTIADRDEVSGAQAENNYYASGISDLFKKVRVVVSVEYSIQ
jgi:uncharacterized protein